MTFAANPINQNILTESTRQDVTMGGLGENIDLKKRHLHMPEIIIDDPDANYSIRDKATGSPIMYNEKINSRLAQG